MSRDPYPVTAATLYTVYMARPDQAEAILERAGFVQTTWGREPTFRGEHGGNLGLDDVFEEIRANPAARFDIYQAWMDISRRGY